LHQEKTPNLQLTKLRGKILNPPKRPSPSTLSYHTPKKKFQAAVSLMMLNKNLLYSTLGFQITNDWVEKNIPGLQAEVSLIF